MSTKTQDPLDAKIDLIYDALEKAEPFRILRVWCEDGPAEDVLEAMCRAIRKVDGELTHTTDALAAAFEAGLLAFTPKVRAARRRRVGKRRPRPA